MNLSELCIRRPVFASVLSLVVLLVGLMAYSRLPVREYPNIDEPVVSVTTDYSGASPEIIESQVTQPLEEVLSGIEGVDLIGTVGQFIGIPPERMLFCGMAIGHANPSHPVNALRSKRAPLETFARFHDVD